MTYGYLGIQNTWGPFKSFGVLIRYNKCSRVESVIKPESATHGLQSKHEIRYSVQFQVYIFHTFVE